MHLSLLAGSGGEVGVALRERAEDGRVAGEQVVLERGRTPYRRRRPLQLQAILRRRRRRRRLFPRRSLARLLQTLQLALQLCGGTLRMRSTRAQRRQLRREGGDLSRAAAEGRSQRLCLGHLLVQRLLQRCRRGRGGSHARAEPPEVCEKVGEAFAGGAPPPPCFRARAAKPPAPPPAPLPQSVSPESSAPESWVSTGRIAEGRRRSERRLRPRRVCGGEQARHRRRRGQRPAQLVHLRG
mmetsp:Transcript_179/g.658  ORF Transcript_179/g.658 Transcript_179/m.658 type:complete len:240 (+) Transcript_179:1442-2161(+)